MGFFMIEFEGKEELSFNLFSQLLEKSMMPIFVDNFANLQMNFYIVDRFNSLFIPDLWEHFRVRPASPRKRGSSPFSTAPAGSSPCSATPSSTPSAPT